MSSSADVIIVVHGSHAHTWWRRMANGGYAWWRHWSLFCNAIRQAYGKPCEIREYWWTGNNTHQARLDAGAGLATVIARQYSARTVHLVGHSHGGNVALAAVGLLPAGSVDTVVLLANPNLTVPEKGTSTRRWMYWEDVEDRAERIWNLYSPEDRIQTRIGRIFHGLPSTHRSDVRVEAAYTGRSGTRVNNGAIHWARPAAAHRAMHSAAVGTVVGRLLEGTPFVDALRTAGLTRDHPNQVADRGGFAGTKAAQEMIRANANPEPFHLGPDHAEVGVLFIHGFTASPAEMRPMAEFIHEKTGWKCRAVVLPGHGTKVEDLQNARGGDWVMAVQEAYDTLAQECRHLFLVGMSMGAALNCHVASARAAQGNLGGLKGLILLAPAFGISRKRALALPLLRLVKRVRNKGPVAAHYFLDRKLFSYLEDPLNRVGDVLQLGRQAWRNLGRLRDVPVLLFSGELDRTVSLRWMRTAVQRNPWIQDIRLPRSRHILTVEPDSTTVFEKSVQFMEQCLGRKRGNEETTD